MSSRAADGSASGSKPQSRIATAIVVPSASVIAPASCGAMPPAIAREPQKLEGKRLLSSSQNAISSTGRRGGPCSSSSEASARKPQTTPAVPS